MQRKKAEESHTVLISIETIFETDIMFPNCSLELFTVETPKKVRLRALEWLYYLVL